MGNIFSCKMLGGQGGECDDCGKITQLWLGIDIDLQGEESYIELCGDCANAIFDQVNECVVTSSNVTLLNGGDNRG